VEFKIFQKIFMAFRILRLRKEARRNAKLDEIFQERDKEGTGLISYEQLEDIYRIYQVREGGGNYA
jgi:Ca2+-binding EF-hand superfamily protein